MSLYNMLFGTNPFSNALLLMLGVNQGDIPRYRDCFLNEHGTEIIIHTRTGGGNRDEYRNENAALTKVDGYKFDSDDQFDSTYANFHYAVPDAFRKQVELIKDHGAIANPAERWKEVIANLQSGDTSKPDVQRALAVGEQIMNKLR